MIKFYKGNPVYINKKVDGETFKVKVKILYRYSFFKFTVIDIEEELTEQLTYKILMKTLKEQIDNLDKICK